MSATVIATPIADALQEGREAWKLGGDVDENPYEDLTPKSLAWIIGFAIERESCGGGGVGPR
jgi:hypothetical protein